MPGRSVTCITTGEEYSSISAAERANDIKSGTLSAHIKSQEEVDGKLYQFTDQISVSKSEQGLEKSEEPKEELKVESDKTEDKKSDEKKVSPKSKKKSKSEKTPIIGSRVKLYELAQSCRLKGYDCEVVEGFMVFFQIRSQEALDDAKSIMNKHPEFKGMIRFTAHDSERYKYLVDRK